MSNVNNIRISPNNQVNTLYLVTEKPLNSLIVEEFKNMFMFLRISLTPYLTRVGYDTFSRRKSIYLYDFK